MIPMLALLLLVASCGGASTESADGNTSSPTDGPQRVADLSEIRGLIDEGQFGDAEQRARGILEEMTKTRGADSLEAASALDLLVEALWRGGKVMEPETLKLARRAVITKEDRLGADHEDLADSLDNLGVVLRLLGENTEAKQVLRRALNVRRRTAGAYHPSLATTLDYLGIILHEEGQFAEAERHYRRSLAIREEAFGKDHFEVAASVNLLGVLLWETGDYAAARPLYERALAIRTRERGPNHPSVAGVLNNFGILLYDMGEDERARELFTRALEIRLETDSPRVAATLNNLAHVVWREGDYEEARKLVRRAIEIWEKHGGKQDTDLALSLHLAADIEYSLGNYSESRRLFEQAVEIWEDALGSQHPRLGLGLAGLGKSLRNLGQLESSRSRIEQALAIWDSSLGPDHPYTSSGLQELALLLCRMGETSGCLSAALQAEESSRRHLRLTSRSLAEEQSLRYAAVRASGLGLALTLSAEGLLDPAGRRAVLDAMIRSRALVLDEMASRHRSLSAAEDSKTVALAKALNEKRTKLANLMVRGVPSGEPGRFAALLDEARREKERAERELASRSVLFRRDDARQRIGLADVSESLPRGSALVSLARYAHQSLDQQNAAVASYLALVLSEGDDSPTAVVLGSAAEIDGRIARWRDELSRRKLRPAGSAGDTDSSYREVGRRLREVLWDPIAERLGDTQLVFIVPDGAPQLVNLATLPVGEAGFLVETGPVLHYLSAERDLVPEDRFRGGGTGLLALGDPAFDADLSPDAPARPLKDESEPAGRPWSGCGDFRSLRFGPLPATALEVRDIAALWDRHHDAPAVVLTTEQASEETFKRQAGGQRVLHLATHGFFLNGDCPSARDGTRGIGGLSDGTEGAGRRPDAGGPPLRLSGLVLAGANRRAERGQEEEDGILTAEEIAALDLSAVEWAVLSACDTGVGDVLVGEGVSGLRRAFHVAGVNSLIMSLWAVEDRSARDWMHRLYRARLEGLSTSAAVRRASIESLESRRRAGADTHPFFWGAFVATGDWR